MSSNKQTKLDTTVGLVLDFFNPRVLEGAQAYLEKQGVRLDARWSVRGDWTPKKPGWDGVILGIVDDAELRQRITSWKIPKVSLTPEDDVRWQVKPDYRKCGMLAGREAVDAGASVLLTSMVSHRRIDVEFCNGLQRFAEQNDIPCYGLELETPSLRKILKSISERIRSLPLPLGFCQPHAGVAYSLQQRLIENGLRIPEDVSMVVIEKDIQRTASLATVPLTTVEINEWHRGFIAAEMLHRQLIGEPLPQPRVIIPPRGITRRESTGHQEVSDHIAATVLHFIRQNFLKPIRVTDVVATTGASRRKVEMRFREVMNRGIHEELNRLRIEEAKRLLSNSGGSITTIAESCAFSSVHYFSATFKRETGLSPKQFRKQIISDHPPD